MIKTFNAPLVSSLKSLLPGVLLSDKLMKLKVSGVCLDSRQVKPGDLFFAIPGAYQDGRDYIQSSLKAGAEIVLCHADSFCFKKHARVVAIPDLNKKISKISGQFYSNPSHKVALTGVTGTNGKTTCTQLLSQLFSLAGDRAGVMGTLGHGCVESGKSELKGEGMTTPDPITIQAVLADFAERNIKKAVIEVSSHSLSQFRVHGLLFDTAIFTNLTHDHLDYHGDIASYSAAKKQLFSMPGLKNAVINEDDPVGLEIAQKLPSSTASFTFSLVNPAASIYAQDIKLTGAGIVAHILTPWGDGMLKSPLIGRFNLLNLLAVLGAACCQGLMLQEVLKLIPCLGPIPGRMEVISGPACEADKEIFAPMIVVDFAHTPDALKNALEALKYNCNGKLWCVFGCGGDRDKAKRSKMGKIADQLADKIVVTNDNPRGDDSQAIIDEILSGICFELRGKKSVHIIPDRRKAIQFSIESAAQEDVVLIAGKGHELYQIIGSNVQSFSDQAEARLALSRRGWLA